jgi:hypothetical protein
VRSGSGFAAGEVARVVFDALAKPHSGHHFEIVVGAHPKALGFDEFSVLFKVFDLAVGFLADFQGGPFHFIAGSDELLRWEKRVILQAIDRVTR